MMQLFIHSESSPTVKSVSTCCYVYHVSYCSVSCELLFCVRHMSYCSVSCELQCIQVDDTLAELSRANYAAFWINKKSINVAPMESHQVQVVHSYYGNIS